jgi:epsilon-lactone hydrolase
MTSLRAKLFSAAMKVFFGYVMPANMPLKTYRKFANQPLFERMPRDIAWKKREINSVTGEWITPSNAISGRILLYLHGGGYALKTPHVHRVLVGRLARATKCQAFMVDYRLAPENPFPAALEDVIAAYRGLLTEGYLSSQIVVAGDSAGGGLVGTLLISLRDAGAALPAAACLISAMLDCTFSDDTIPELQKHDPYLRISDLSMMAKYYYGDYDPQNPLISPLYAELQDLPPLLIYAGENEVLRSDAVRFAEKAQEAGVDVTLKVWQGMVHAFPIYAGFLPEGKTAITEIGTFFQKFIRLGEQSAKGDV